MSKYELKQVLFSLKTYAS